MGRTVTIELLDEIQGGFNRQDVEAILTHFAEDCEWLMARGPNAPEARRCVSNAADSLQSEPELLVMSEVVGRS